MKSISRLSRLFTIRSTIKKYGLAGLTEQLELPTTARLVVRLAFGSGKNLSDDNRAKNIRLALQELGPIFVKLGQTLSTRPDLIPADIAIELAQLQDNVPAFDSKQAMQLIHQAYGDDFDDIFESVETQPLASASVAQVHTAKLKKGKALEGKNGKKSVDVIIKIIRPDIEKVINSDLEVMHTFAGFLQRHWSRGKQLRPLDVIKEYDATIKDELDLRLEAANCVQMADQFTGNDIIYVPIVYWDYTQANVMVMERIYGTPIREIETLKNNGIDLEQLASDGVSVFYKQVFEHNFFHADMHPGNIFVSDEGRWIAIDFGIMCTLTEQDKQYLAKMFLGFFNRDYKSIAQAHFDANWISQNTNAAEFESAVRVICEPIFAKPMSEISFGKVLMQLFGTAQRFELIVQPQLVLLYKTLLNTEGLGRQLYPELNLWDTAKPFLENWMKEQFKPKRLMQDIQKDWLTWQTIIPTLPQHLINSIEQAKPENVAKHAAQLQQQLSSQRKQSQRTSFHQILGFGGAVAGLSVYLLTQNSYLTSTSLTDAAPYFGVLGIAWAYFFSRK